MERTYIAIDLKSFYASVECAERGLDPLKTNLVVADAERTQKTICLAVSPSLKDLGIPGRPRLFEVEERVREINAARRSQAAGRRFYGESCDADALRADRGLAVSYLVARPRMAYYMKYSTQIYRIYLRYAAPEDIHVYSIDEVFIDATQYLRLYGLSAHAFVRKLIEEVLRETGITATAGIGSNLYLCKIAMDIMAKRVPADKDGVRIAALDERSYREKLWDHRPLRDFWRVGRGYEKRLASVGLHTMRQIARCSVGGADAYYNEELLYRMFGVNAELLIDHAWGYESCTIADIKAYRPESSSLSTGQVLKEPYAFEKARIIVREMADSLAFSLLEKGLLTDQIVLTVGYDVKNLQDSQIRKIYRGEIKTDRYGRCIPKAAHGSVRLERKSASARLIAEKAAALYDQIADRRLFVRRMCIAAVHLTPEADGARGGMDAAYVLEADGGQLSLFADYGKPEAEAVRRREAERRERRVQEAVLSIRQRFGKNAVVMGTSLEEGATGMERGRQIGGHRA